MLDCFGQVEVIKFSRILFGYMLEIERTHSCVLHHVPANGVYK